MVTQCLENLILILILNFICILVSESSTSDLSLSHGGTYYISVEACNSVGLCSRASSNGMTVDMTPPTCGRVYDGPDSGSDLQYQTSS